MSALTALRWRMHRWFLRGGEARGWRRLRWPRLALVVGGAALACDLALAGAVYGFARYRQHIAGARFVDVALPWRWDRYRVARGDHYLRRALDGAREGRIHEALVLARSGLARSPANRDGRLLLTDLLLGLRRISAARQTLFEGLPHHGRDAAYLQRVAGFLLQQQEDSHVVALAEKFLRHNEPGSEAARVLALAAATARYHRGHYDQAEDFLRRAHHLADSRDGQLLRAKIERDRGYPELALVQLRALAAAFPHDPEVHGALADLLRARGRSDEARRATLAYQIAHPQQAGARLALLREYREAGESHHVAAEIAALLRDFDNDPLALLGLADFAAGCGDTALVARLARHAEERHVPLDPFTFLRIEAAIVGRSYREALAAIRAEAESPAGRRHRALFHSLAAIAHLALGDTANARTYLSSYLAHPNLRAENLLVVANRLAALDAPEPAREALQRAIEIDPLNQAALARLIEFDLILNRIEDLPAHLERFVKMRRPSPDILRVVRHKLGSDLFLFSDDAASALHSVRQALADAERRH